MWVKGHQASQLANCRIFISIFTGAEFLKIAREMSELESKTKVARLLWSTV